MVALDELDEGFRESEERSISSATDRMSSGEAPERDMELDTRYGGRAGISAPL